MNFLLSSGADWSADVLRRPSVAPEVRQLARACQRLAMASASGVPARHAVEFAELLLFPSVDDKNPYRVIVERMKRELDLKGLPTTGRNELLRALQKDPFVACQLVLAPVALRLDRHLRNVLISLPELDVPTQSTVVAVHVDSYASALEQLVHSKDGGDVAWIQGLAVQLWQRIFSSPTPNGQRVDPLARQIFLTMRRAVPSTVEVRQRAAQVSEDGVRQSGRPQQAGVVGIRHASAGEDPSAMLPSYQVLPGHWLQDKILNEGFLAFDRPPAAPFIQNFLCVAIVEDVAEGPLLSMVKAAWWECCRQFEATLGHLAPNLVLGWLPYMNDRLQRDVVLQTRKSTTEITSVGRPVAYLASFEVEGAPFLAPPPLHGAPSQQPRPPTSGVLQTYQLDSMIDALDFDLEHVAKAYVLHIRPTGRTGDVDVDRIVLDRFALNPKVIPVEGGLVLPLTASAGAKVRYDMTGGRFEFAVEDLAETTLCGLAASLAGRMAQTMIRQI